MIKGKAHTAVNKATHLMAIEHKLGEGTLRHTMAHSVAKRKAKSIVQSEVQIKELCKIRNLPPPPLAQGGRPKEDLDSDSNEPPDNCAGSTGKVGSKSEDSMPKGDIGKQIQDMQDKADFISKIQRELRQEIHAFKLKRLQDRGINSDMVNTWTGNGTSCTLAEAPDHGAHKEWPSGALFHNKIDTVNIGNRGTE
jgi:hypothetical protein